MCSEPGGVVAGEARRVHGFIHSLTNFFLKISSGEVLTYGPPVSQAAGAGAEEDFRLTVGGGGQKHGGHGGRGDGWVGRMGAAEWR